jgi:glycosyltransferase involved in cell wall biosynthesis
LARNLWTLLKRRAPRVARLVKVGVIDKARAARPHLRWPVSQVCKFTPMAVAKWHVTHQVAARAMWIRPSAHGCRTRVNAYAPERGMTVERPTGAGGGVKPSVVQRLCDELAIGYLERHYRRICHGLLRERCDGWQEPGHVARTSILLVSGTLGPGGAERQAIMTLAGLAARGYRDVGLLCVHLSGEINSFFGHLLEGCPVSVAELRRDLLSADVERAGGRTGNRAGLKRVVDRLPVELSEIPLYAREIVARRPRLVHTWLDDVNVKAGLAAVMVGVPRVVLSTRSVAPDNFSLFQPYMREAYRALMAQPGVVALNNSKAGARDYEAWLGLPRGTVKVVRNGFDFSGLERQDHLASAREFRARFGIPAAAPVVGSVLRFSEEKQPLLWIDVAERIGQGRKDAMFLMVGDGPLREEARRRAKAKGFGDRIVMPGYERSVEAAMAAMDVFLLTSRLEGLPNVLIEAQALGVPVVTTDAGGAAETLDNGRTGFAVSPPSAELLAQAILRVLGDEEWREAARVAAPQFVRERFSAALMVEQTLDAYLGRGEFAPTCLGCDGTPLEGEARGR